jgi:hypothetical protein
MKPLCMMALVQAPDVSEDIRRVCSSLQWTPDRGPAVGTGIVGIRTESRAICSLHTQPKWQLFGMTYAQ